MEDYILKQIDMIGQMLRYLARKLHLFDGNVSDVPIEIVQNEIERDGLGIDVKDIIIHENPVVYLAEELKFSDEAIETFAGIAMHTDIPQDIKDRILDDTIEYLSNKGFFSFLLQSFCDSR